MKNVDRTFAEFFEKYEHNYNSIEKDVNFLIDKSIHIINEYIQSAINNYYSKLYNISRKAENYIDDVCATVKNDILEVNDAKDEKYSSDFSHCANIPKSVNRDTYKSIVKKVVSKAGSTIDELANVMAGEFCNSYRLKDRKPVKIWKWEDRLVYIKGLLSERKLSDEEKLQIKELKHALTKNNYLKYKKSEKYAELNDFLNKYS